MSSSNLSNLNDCGNVETFLLCDKVGEVSTRFLRTITFDCEGVYVSHVDNQLDGTTAYVVAGTATDCNIDYEQVCYRPIPTPCPAPIVTADNPSAVIPEFSRATVVANPNNIGVVNLPSSHDGDASGGSWSRFNTGNADAIGLVVDWLFLAPQSNPSAIQLFTQGGADVGDCDGVGSAVATLYNAAGTILWSGALVGGNGGTGWLTDLPTGLVGITRMRLSNITKSCGGAGAPNIHIRNIRLLAEYSIIYDYDCHGVTIEARGDAGTVTITSTTITQTTTPHVLTFDIPGSSNWQATVVTDQPGRFSRLTVNQNNPTVTFTGTGVANFVVSSVDYDQPENLTRVGTMQFDGLTRTLHDTLTGVEVTGQEIVQCCCDEAPAADGDTDPTEVQQTPSLSWSKFGIYTNPAAWSSAQVTTGRVLTGLSATVTVGTATVIDADGVSSPLVPVGFTAAWQAELNGSLNPPMSITPSITPAVASTVIVTWTER